MGDSITNSYESQLIILEWFQQKDSAKIYSCHQLPNKFKKNFIPSQKRQNKNKSNKNKLKL